MEGGLKGLVIVFSAFMIQVLAFGNYACVGIYTVHLLDVFDDDAVGVSLITAIHFASLLCCGPITSFMMTKISYRKLCLAGAALVSIGIFCTPLVINLPAMYVFFGVFAGFGGCLIYLPSHVLSGMYYTKHRSLATGVATAGTGMGAIIMPLVVGLLIEEYTWKGSLTILAGIDLHLFIFAFFMVPPPEPVAEEPSGDGMANGHTPPIINYQLLQSAESTPQSMSPSCTYYDEVKPLQQSNGDIDMKDSHDTLQNHANGSVPSAARNTDHLTVNYPRDGHSPGSHRLSISSFFESARHRVSLAEDDISMLFIPSYLAWRTRSRASSCSHAPDDAMSKCLETAILTSEIPEMPNLESEGTDNTSTEIISSLASDTAEENEQQALVGTIKHHIAILFEFRFFIYFISTLIWSLTTTEFLTFDPELIVLKGHSAKDAAMVFTFYGVGQLVGCVIISIVGNFFGHRMLLYVGANILTGILIGVAPLFNCFIEIAVLLLSIGLAYGGILGLYMSVTIDLVGMEDMDIGMGYLLLASGLGCFIGPPIGGALSKVFGGYHEVFYMSGILIIFGGLMMFLIYLPRCWKNKCNKNTKT